MKKLLTLCTFAILFFAGCKKDGLTPNEKTEQLLRAQKWVLTEAKVNGTITTKYDGLTLSFGTKV